LPFPSTPHDSGLVVPPEKLSTFSHDHLVRFINETIAPESVFGDKTDEVRAKLTWFYADRNASENADAGFYLTRYTQVLSDAQFAIPVLTEVRRKSEENWPVHLYLLNYMNPAFKLPVLGTYQTYELPYLFGISVVAPFELDDNDRKLRQVMVSAVTNFVHTGNPSSHFGPWPAVTEEHPLGFFDMRPEPVLRDNLMLDRFVFWKNLTDSYDFDIVRGTWKSTGKPKNEF
ncbi:Protein K07C11.4, partial [Aphelenchoides avenae]